MRDGEIKMVSMGDESLACLYCSNTGKNQPKVRFATIELEHPSEYVIVCAPCFNVKFKTLLQGAC